MDWNFSIGWFLIGLGILIAGGLIVFYHQKIADNFVNGVSSYDKVKLVGIIISILGLVIMANLHTLILSAIVNLVFRR